MKLPTIPTLFAVCVALLVASTAQAKYNVLFIISDDLTSTALSCYGNKACQTPNIDRIAARGTRFTRAYCQGTYCGPSRASFMSGYYPHATGVLGYISPRKAIGDRATWAQHFKNSGYYTARVSKIFHMGVPGGIEKGTDGADDPISWTERFNSQGPEWRAPGVGETLESNPDGKRSVVGGNTFVVVQADGDDLVHSDGKTAAKACELIEKHKDETFFLGVGFVRPHVPFVSPRSYYAPFPHDEMKLPEKVKGDWDDIPRAGINYKTSTNMKMSVLRQKKAVSGYYASVAYMDAQVGKVMNALKNAELDEKTIVIFTSDHGYHLGEHDFWAKVSLHEESALVPLIISVPGKKPAVCDSFAELLDLYPTLSSLCGLDVPSRLQGKDISKMLDNPSHTVRDAAFCVNGRGFLLREEKWAYLQYGENAGGGIELFDMENDPLQYTNLADKPQHKTVVDRFKAKLAAKLKEVRTNDLDKTTAKRTGKRKARKKAKKIEAKSVTNAAKSKSLFNGKDLTGWHVDVPHLDKNPKGKQPFIVRDGNLVSLGTPAGHLITDAVYKNYRLEVQYRFATKPGNCGVLVHASTPRALYKMFPKSIEVQMYHKNAGDFWCIVEDITVPDMVKRRGPKEKWGITEGKARRILNLTDGSEKPPGEWNTMVIECVKDEVKVWVNGDLVNHGTKCTAQKGHIAVQAEGSEVEFRKIVLMPIKELSKNGR